MSAHQTQVSAGTIVALSMLTNPAAVVAVIAPAVVNALVGAGRFPLSVATLIGAAELAGMTVALLLGPAYLALGRKRLLAVAAIGLAIAGQIGSMLVPAAGLVAAARAIAGMSEGVLYAMAIAALATSPSPDRAFGVMITVNQVASSVLLAIIAWLGLRHSFYGPVAVVVVFTLLTGAFIAVLSAAPAKRAAARRIGDVPTTIGMAGVAGVAGVFLLAGGFGLVWPVIGQIALNRHLQPADVAGALSLAGVGGILGGIVAALIGGSLGRTRPLALFATGFALSLAVPTDPLPFAAVAFAIVFFWTLSLPYFLGLVSWFDQTGRLTVVASAMIPAGIAAGQATAGALAIVQPLSVVTLIGGGTVLAAVGTMIAAAGWLRAPAPALASASASAGRTPC